MPEETIAEHILNAKHYSDHPDVLRMLSHIAVDLDAAQRKAEELFIIATDLAHEHTCPRTVGWRTDDPCIRCRGLAAFDFLTRKADL